MTKYEWLFFIIMIIERIQKVSLLNNRRYSRKSECKEVISDLEQNMLRRKADLSEIEEALPKKNGLYLRIILGNVNVSILNKDEKYAPFIFT